MQRETIEIGPAKWTWGAKDPFYSRSPADVSINSNRFPVGSELTGDVDERFIGHSIEVTVTPDGRFNTDLISALWPHLNITPGSSLFASGAATALVGNSLDGKIHTILDAALTKMPDIVWAPNKDMIGAVTYTGVPCYGKAPGAAASLYAVTAGALTMISDFVASDYRQSMGLLGLDTSGTDLTSIESEDGWTASFDMDLSNIELSGVLRDIRCRSIGCMIRGIPANGAIADILTLMGVPAAAVAGHASGASLLAATTTGQATIAGGGLTLTIPKCAVVTAGFRFGNSVIRQGEIGLVGIRQIAAGVPQAIATIVAT